MRIRLMTGALTATLLVAGCVGKGTHTETLAELDTARKTSAKTSAVLEEAKKDAAARIKALEEEKAQLAQELAVEQQAGSRTRQALVTSNESLAQALKRQRDLEEEAQKLRDEGQQADRLYGEARRERDQEIGTLRQTVADRAAQAVKLEQERAAKEAEIQRLNKTHDDLAKSLQDEIAKGDIKIKQVRDRLTINMVDRVLFDSGQAQVKPAGLKVLKQVSDVLTKVTDKQIRIEGHTDNVPIGIKLREKFSTNWELSTARATSVVRYLIEEGGVDRTLLAAGGYADTQPLESNETEAGKTANRRIEIVLYPKDLGGIAGQMK